MFDNHTHNCLLFDKGLPGKHQAHGSHWWWHTSSGGGHQLDDGWEPDGKRYNDYEAEDTHEGTVTRWYCPGRD